MTAASASAPSAADPPSVRSHVTLALCTILHGFTHAYGTLLVPLFLLMAADLHLPGAGPAAFLNTLYGLVYCLLSLAAGILADRVDRKTLLGVGLVGNALAITLMGFTHAYPLLLLLAVAGGAFGTLFHPAANALVPAHYPRSPGMAIGLLGMGSGLGFFVGPQYAGWRAEAATWQLGGVSAWQRPLVELGLVGILFGIAFLLLAREAPAAAAAHAPATPRPTLTPALRRRVLAIAATLGCRDFAGVASLTLAGLYLQKVHDKSVRDTGLILGLMMLIGVVANPVAVWLSPGKRRLPALTLLLIVGAAFVALAPHVPFAWLLLVLVLFQSAQLATYAVSDAAMLERVPNALRGRVVGLFLMLAGTFASTSPWVMAFWVDRLGPRSHDQAAYALPFATLAALMLIATTSVRMIDKLGHLEAPAIEPMAEVSPGTMEVVG